MKEFYVNYIDGWYVCLGDDVIFGPYNSRSEAYNVLEDKDRLQEYYINNGLEKDLLEDGYTLNNNIKELVLKPYIKYCEDNNDKPNETLVKAINENCNIYIRQFFDMSQVFIVFEKEYKLVLV